MKNQYLEKDLLAFLDQCKYLLQNKMYADVLALAEERLKILPMDADAYAAIGEALIAMGLVDKARDLLRDVETNISAMSFVFARMGELYAEKGYEKDAQFCYQKFRALNPSDNRQELAMQRAIIEDVKIIDNQTDQQHNIPSSDHLIKTLSGWLVNIHRIKTHAENDK